MVYSLKNFFSSFFSVGNKMVYGTYKVKCDHKASINSEPHYMPQTTVYCAEYNQKNKYNNSPHSTNKM